MMARFANLALLSLISHLLLRSCASAAAPSVQHTLGTGSSLSVEDHERPFLVSPDATFSCGFLQAGDNAFYFSVWFTAAKNRTAVWTANPGAPVNGRVSSISFSPEGQLALADANGTTVWNSKTGGKRHLTVSLRDTGNLLIADPSTGRAVWQSFDWPTDTLLPSQTLSKDKKLVAGYYALYYDNDNVLRLLYDGPEIASIYWPNPDHNVFDNGRTNYNSSRMGVLDDTGVFVSSDNLRVEASDLGAAGVKRRLTIEQDGNVRIYSLNAAGGWTVTWAALKQPCSVHGLCGKNALCEYQPSLRCSCAPGYEMVDRHDWRKGCKPTFSLPTGTTNCSEAPASERFTFVQVAATDFYGYDLGFNQSVTFEYCKSMCLKMCSCAAFAYRLDGRGNCFPKGVLFNGYTSPAFPGNIYLKVRSDLNLNATAPQLSVQATGLACNRNGSRTAIVPRYADTYGTPTSGTKWSYFFGFAAVLGFLELLFVATAWWFLSSQESMPSSLQAGYGLVMATQFRRFTYRELKNATGDFNEELGRGGSGVVYRGVLDKTTVVAVKKLTNVVQGEEEFWAEMTVFGRINHINLVRIWGFCSEGKHKLLVYEYVENESLDRHLFGKDIGKSLAWSERFKIALGTARGLAYLHHECLEWVIHCDVKPENILLTRDLDAKIADFGLAKLSGRNTIGNGKVADTGVQLSHMRGTAGYMAPEWALGLPVDAKVDVYSYGIVILEIVIGSRISAQTTTDGGERLEMWQIAQALKQVVASGDIMSLVDSRLNGQFNPRQAMEMVKISLSCMEERSNRPTMDDISKALTACDDEDEHPAYLS
ncbi:putative receptor protein kinase ZmPK1 [Triticum dicoccoides]|uniref:putative receptor protein kinase ZmPK1 n=1 Tax=Triticum dicoccoides TaxID=85692 RepID=UPI00188E777B|nr:putative receptor protein kinase ZmPK1 [Triticum dicoccoides]